MPFVNLPDTHKSRRGDELTAERMKECVCLPEDANFSIVYPIGAVLPICAHFAFRHDSFQIKAALKPLTSLER